MVDWHQDWFGATTQWHQDWFGVTDDPFVPGSGPDGVATFALELESGYTVTYGWRTDVRKSRSGKEQRASRNDRPKEFYRGSCLMFGAQPATIRAQLARYAAQGAQFMLGLPHEELTFTQAASGSTVYVTSTALSDWMNAGQRAICKRRNPTTQIVEAVDCVIQSKTSNSITLDVSPGSVGGVGGSIMPAQAIYLEPEQAFPRYAVEAERWDIDARAASFGFARTLASLALDPVTVSEALNGVAIRARVAGAIVSFGLINNPGAANTLSESPGLVMYNVSPGVTTLGQMKATLDTSTLVQMVGTWTDADTIAAGDCYAVDDGDALPLTGGAASGPVGTGASVTTYASRPLWTPRVENEETITDSVHAMTEVLDFGGIPYAVGSADYADWGRTIEHRGDLGADWQFWKLFMVTVVGRQKAFWLSTYRDDLPFVSKAANTITVTADVGAWWPLQRQHVEVKEASGTVTRAQVTAATDNGNGTWTLTIGTTLASSSVEMVSWIELCRMTSDDFVVSFTEYGFEVTMVATVVQQ